MEFSLRVPSAKTHFSSLRPKSEKCFIHYGFEPALNFFSLLRNSYTSKEQKEEQIVNFSWFFFFVFSEKSMLMESASV